MDGSPFVFSEDSFEHALCLKSGPYAGRPFSVEFVACANPLCRCSDLSLRCVPANLELSDGLPALEFTLDVLHRRVKPPIERLPEETLNVAEELVAEMTVRDWRKLYQFFYACKEEQTADVDCATLSPSFPPEVMSDPSIMVAYKEIFPWACAFDFHLEQDHWIFDDQYCVNPSCRCQDAVIVFLRIAERSDGRAEVVQQMPPARYDGRRCAFRAMEPPWSDKPSLEAIVNALRRVYPALDRSLGDRRKNLRMLYEKAAARAKARRIPPPVRSKPPGPNPPCPCGSGKKFKRCCGQET